MMFYETRDSRGEHPRFAGTCACNYEEGTFVMQNCFALGGVQSRERLGSPALRFGARYFKTRNH